MEFILGHFADNHKKEYACWSIYSEFVHRIPRIRFTSPVLCKVNFYGVNWKIQSHETQGGLNAKTGCFYVR